MQKANIIKLVVLAILLLSISTIIFFKYFYSTNELTAEIYQNGKLLYSIDLEKVSESYEITIPGADSESFNTVLVEEGSISMKNASCPDHICVKTGKISSPLLPITCLPNKIVIRIKTDSTENLDSIAY